MENSMTPGDYLNPEPKSPSKNKFIGIILAVIVLGGVSAVGYYYYNSGGVRSPEALVPPQPEPVKPPEPVKSSEQIKAAELLKSQNDALDKLREQNQRIPQATTTTTTTPQYQMKSLDTLRSEALKQNTISASPSKTAEQQSQELDALRAAAIK